MPDTALVAARAIGLAQGVSVEHVRRHVKDAASKRISDGEFVVLTALGISLVAMSIDSMLPALGDVARDLGVLRANDRQLILTTFFGGLTVGQLAYGPVSDAVGRKRTMYLGLGVLAMGTLLCLVAQSFAMMLVGRVLAGLGAAGPRIVSVAIVRDRYAGRAMARLMSIVMTVFILVPVFAPSVGQGAMHVGSWRAIFGLLLAMTLATGAWFALRQDETLPAARRRPLSLGPIKDAMVEALVTRLTLGYALGAGLVFGGMLAFLSSAQQIFAEQYGLGDRFPLYFAALASSLGVASLLNATLVDRFGMEALSTWALRVSTTLSIGFAVLVVALHGRPPLTAFVGYFVIVFFCNGLMFGNFNAIAMEPMGHIAGSAAAVIGALTSLVSVVIGTPIGRAYDGTVTPLVAGMAIVTACALVITWWAASGRREIGATSG